MNGYKESNRLAATFLNSLIIEEDEDYPSGSETISIVAEVSFKLSICWKVRASCFVMLREPLFTSVVESQSHELSIGLVSGILDFASVSNTSSLLSLVPPPML